ncbi:DUF2306 domain-containing protein [bacterium AH-315-P15]|nr:DUF2306 domain-containing protein [bacterium AH-315-P15]
MTDRVSTGPASQNSVADNALKGSAALWWLTALIGMWIFVYYLLAYYVSPVLQGGLEVLSNTRLPMGYIPGDTLGNFAIAMHLFVAVTIIGLGPLQLVPQIRSRFPIFHHWNGRLYMLTVFAASLAGLYMVWIRGGSIGNLVQNISISLDAVLIMVFAIMALRYAIARDIPTHRRWALRLFMVVSAVWFLRIGYQLWNFLNNGSIAYDPGVFSSTFFTFWSFGQYLLPLAILELYLRTQDRAGARGKFAMAAGLLVVTALMGVGIYAATFGMWLPRL